jgi:tungstate transport system ATP-binding protein
VKAGAAYSIRSLRHSYDGRTVLSIPNLDIASGEITAIAGLNGSGKTTLLQLLALLMKHDSGSIAINGSDVSGERERASLRRSVTLIHQKPVLFSTSVRNNIAYGLRAAGRPAHEIRKRVDRVLERLELSALADRPARKLSGGEAQRVVLARGLVLETPIVLLDEPTSFLDDSVRPLLFEQLMQSNQERGTTVLMATHDLRFASSMASRIVRLDQGMIIEDRQATDGMADPCGSPETTETISGGRLD